MSDHEYVIETEQGVVRTDSFAFAQGVAAYAGLLPDGDYDD